MALRRAGLARLMSTKINYESYLSRVSARRKPSPIRALQPLLSVPDMISLGGGMPNPKTFPISSLKFTLKVR
jgi:kynurenine/2-aminoadipate aminotransferase